MDHCRLGVRFFVYILNSKYFVHFEMLLGNLSTWNMNHMLNPTKNTSCLFIWLILKSFYLKSSVKNVVKTQKPKRVFKMKISPWFVMLPRLTRPIIWIMMLTQSPEVIRHSSPSDRNFFKLNKGSISTLGGGSQLTKCDNVLELTPVSISFILCGSQISSHPH